MERIYIATNLDTNIWFKSKAKVFEVVDKQRAFMCLFEYKINTNKTTDKKLIKLGEKIELRRQKVNSEDPKDFHRIIIEFLQSYLDDEKKIDFHKCDLCIVGDKLKEMYEFLIEENSMKGIVDCFHDVLFFPSMELKNPKDSLSSRKEGEPKQTKLNFDKDTDNYAVDESNDYNTESSSTRIGKHSKNTKRESKKQESKKQESKKQESKKQESKFNTRDAKAKLMLELQKRLIYHISKRLFHNDKTIVLDNKQMLNFLKCILLSDNEEEFRNSWNLLDEKLEIILSKEDFQNLREEAVYYNTIATYLYPMDHWDN